MVEAGAEEISEDDMLAAMKFGGEALAAFCQAQDEFVAEWEQVNGPIVKKEYPLDQPVEEVQSASSPTTTRWLPPFATPTSSPVSVRSRL